MTRFEKFIQQRKYLTNVSGRTLEWYAQSFAWLSSETPTQDELNTLVIQMREAGLKETGVNCRLRAINAYLQWSTGTDRRCGAGCTHPRAKKLREPEFLPPTWTQASITTVMRWKPQTFGHHQDSDAGAHSR